MKKQKIYSNESALSEDFTKRNNILYSKIAKGYDILIKVLPIWNNWNSQAIPHIEGKRILEVSFGTGLLLSKYASNYETFGIDYNPKMVEIAKKNIHDKGISAQIIQGNVESLPYKSNSFDTVLNTMAFSGYPDSLKAMSELKRVLKPGGKMIIVDINFPKNMNILGMWLTKFWILLGDLIRDMGKIFNHFDLDYTDKEIGGFGSVHLYIATKSFKEVITQQNH
jgi:ubiquinone/menaquinone biosynthesis C-methylase UbiE